MSNKSNLITQLRDVINILNTGDIKEHKGLSFDVIGWRTLYFKQETINELIHEIEKLTVTLLSDDINFEESYDLAYKICSKYCEKKKNVYI